MSVADVRRYAAFTLDPAAGNPAGVWIGEALPEPATMQRIAADVGYSETAFVAPATGRDRRVRYFSPAKEVPFCGHATIATGVELARQCGTGVYRLETPAGRIPVAVEEHGGNLRASLTSAAPRVAPAADRLIARALAALDWCHDDLDPSIPPVKAFAGAWHLVLAVARRVRLDALEYDFERLRDIMQAEELTTLQLVWRQEATVFHSRNPFPVGGVVEDPATGAAAAALGGYLRESGLIDVPATLTVRQGEAMGRPSVIAVEIPPAGGIVVSGTAVPIEA